MCSSSSSAAADAAPAATASAAAAASASRPVSSFFAAAATSRVARVVFVALIAVSARAADVTTSDCSVCGEKPDVICLNNLGDELMSMDDKDRLEFQKKVLSSAFQQSAHIRQVFPDAESVTCAALSDKACLSELDSQMWQLEPDTKLNLLVSSCNMMQHWSSFREETQQAAHDAALSGAKEDGSGALGSNSAQLAGYGAALLAAGVVVGVVAHAGAAAARRTAGYAAIPAEKAEEREPRTASTPSAMRGVPASTTSHVPTMIV